MVVTCVIRSGRRSLLSGGGRLLRGRCCPSYGDFLEDCDAHTEVDEAAEEEGQVLFPSHYIMGCEVTSAYNDEVTGKMGFTQPVVDDMLTRDFRVATPMAPEELKNKTAVHNIEGFTQSYASGRLFFVVIAEVECLVFSAGRYLVIEEAKSKKRKFICNKEVISALDVRDKLCLVGLGGGYLVLWDLQFLQIKVEVMLPEGSLHVTTVSVTSKYLFATDASQPNNFAYCFDLRTARLKSSSIIASMEPSLRSISVGEDTHVTSCADGVWFMQAGVIKDQLKVTRGMFGHYPKTSMACLAQAGDYVISGGVDGYIYAWRIATLRCTRAMKVHQSQISAMAVKNGQVVIACISGRVKTFSFKATKNEKKTPGPKVDDQEGAVVEDDDEILTFVLMDTYDKQGVIFTIAPSVKDPLLYYCQTREGLLFQKRLPVNDFVPSKKGLITTVQIENITRFNGKAHVQLYQGKVYSIYLMSEKILFLDIHKIEKNSLILHQERLAKLQLSCVGKYLAYIPSFNQVAYLSKGNRVMVAETFSKFGDSLTNANQSNFGENSRDTLQIAHGEQLISLNFISFQDNTFLAATTSSSVHILQREGRLTFQEKCFTKYQKVMPSTVEVAGRKLVYESLCGKWRDQAEDWRALQKEEVKWQEKLLCCKSKSTDTRWKKAGIIMGQGYAIFPK